MRGIVGGQQQVGFGQVLQVDKAVGGSDAGGDAGAVLHRLCPVQRPGAGRQPGGTGLGAALVAVIFCRSPHAQTIGPGFRSINARRGRPPGIGVPVGGLIPLGQRAHRLTEQGRQRGKHIAEQPRDAQRHVDAGTVKQGNRQDFHPRHPV